MVKEKFFWETGTLDLAIVAIHVHRFMLILWELRGKSFFRVLGCVVNKPLKCRHWEEDAIKQKGLFLVFWADEDCENKKQKFQKAKKVQK